MLTFFIAHQREAASSIFGIKHFGKERREAVSAELGQERIALCRFRRYSLDVISLAGVGDERVAITLLDGIPIPRATARG